MPNAFASLMMRIHPASFLRSEQGSLTTVFALTLVLIVIAAGGAIDLFGAYQNRQKLAQVAVLACQYASRPSIIQTASSSYSGTGGGATYVNNVNSFITNSLSSQGFTLSQATGSPFTYTTGGTSDVALSANVPTTFMTMFGINTMPVSVATHCFDSPANVQQVVANGNSAIVGQEGFENTYCSGKCGAQWLVDGSQWNWTSTVPVHNTFTSTVGYTGISGSSPLKWYIMGYCLEIDTVGIAASTTPEGSHGAELDCDNGSASAGNSSMSTLVYFAAGTYQIVYYYVARVPYPNYDTSTRCGSTAASVSSYNDTNANPYAANSVPSLVGHSRSNQVNVYLDLNSSGSPPTHKTIDNTQTLAGSNLIDVCVYSTSWTKRTITKSITTPGYYWLTFAADGAGDSFGGQIDAIQVCTVSCP